MGLSGHRGRTVIGVDLEGRCMRAVQATRTAQAVRVDAAAEVVRRDPFSDVDAEDLALLMEVMDRQEFGSGGLVVGVPTPSLFTEVLELPPRESGAPLEALARVEVARVRRCEPESFELACWDLPAPSRAGDATHMLGMGCAHEPANALIDLFESVGTTVRALDVRACALARALGSSSEPGLTAIVELGWTRARLVALLGGVVLYERRIEDAGLGSVHAEIMRVMDVDAEVADYLLLSPAEEAEAGVVDEVGAILEAAWEGAVEEINASLSYAEHRYPDAEVRRLALVGPGADAARAGALLGTTIGVEPEVVSPATLASCERVDPALASSASMVAALGFAMWEE